MAAEEAIEDIFTAAGEGDAEGVARMLDEGPGLLLTMFDGDTLLTQAAREGHVGVVNRNSSTGVVRLLLERGAEVDAEDVAGRTALHNSAQGGHEEVVSLLLSSGADISRGGLDGWTVLMEASLYGHVGVVRLLLRSMGGRGLDERNDGGVTALWLACCCGYVAVVRALLLAGADHTIADNEGTTPQQIAQSRNHPQCVALSQWWKGELRRAYVLHRARTLHDDTATRQQAPAAAVPAYLSPRVQGGKRLPRVQIQGRGGSGGPRTRGAAKRGAEEGGQEKEEEVCAMVGYVVKDLAAELYIELLAGLHQ